MTMVIPPNLYHRGDGDIFFSRKVRDASLSVIILGVVLLVLGFLYNDSRK